MGNYKGSSASIGVNLTVAAGLFTAAITIAKFFFGTVQEITKIQFNQEIEAKTLSDHEGRIKKIEGQK